MLSGLIAEHPPKDATVYVIVAVPRLTPETIPVELPTAAIPELLLLQTPPKVASDNEAVDPTQVADEPVILATAFTEAVVVAKQPVNKV